MSFRIGSIGLALLAAAAVQAGQKDSERGQKKDAVAAGAVSDPTAIRPFQVAVARSTLADLRRRVLATRWPDKETVVDQSQGVQLAKLQALVKYWGTAYDWRKAEK